jgi:hypothetical protein
MHSWCGNIDSFTFTYSMKQSPSWEADRFPASQEFTAFYETRRFITAITSTRHLSLSWARSIQFTPPHPTSWKIHLNIIHPSTPGTPKWSLSFRFSYLYPVYASPPPHTRYMPHPSHSFLYYLPLLFTLVLCTSQPLKYSVCCAIPLKWNQQPCKYARLQARTYMSQTHFRIPKYLYPKTPLVSFFPVFRSICFWIKFILMKVICQNPHISCFEFKIALHPPDVSDVEGIFFFSLLSPSHIHRWPRINLDTSKSRLEITGKFWNVVLQKDGEEDWTDRVRNEVLKRGISYKR